MNSIYFDLSKAFNKVDLVILSRKMKKIGIQGKLVVWIHNFLKDRKQRKFANGAISVTVSYVYQ